MLVGPGTVPSPHFCDRPPVAPGGEPLDVPFIPTATRWVHRRHAAANTTGIRTMPFMTVDRSNSTSPASANS